LVSACTEPDAVAFTPPGTAGWSADGLGSPSGGGGAGDLVSSGIAANAQTSGSQGNGENVNFYQLEDAGVNEQTMMPTSQFASRVSCRFSPRTPRPFSAPSGI
jgi:hypothetical protein